MRSRHLIALALALVGFDASAGAPAARVDLRFDPPRTVAADDELVVAGTNLRDRPAVVVARVEDPGATDFARRANEERVVLPGAFRFRLPIGALRTPRGTVLDRTALTRILVFPGSAADEITLDRVEIVPAAPLPRGATGFDFGPAAGAVFPGFQPVLPDDARLSGRRISAVDRAGGDALLRDGVVGVERFSTPWPDGHWLIAAWIDDLGEWERLPHPRERRVRANGAELVAYRKSTRDWVAETYLAGRDAEWTPELGPWESFGRRRGGLAVAETAVTGGRLDIDLAGEGADATFIAGLLIAPAGAAGALALAAVEEERRQRFDETWTVDKSGVAVARQRPGLSLHAGDAITGMRPLDRAPIALARGTLTTIDLLATSEASGAPLALSAAMTAVGAAAPPAEMPQVELRWGQWRLERPDTAATILRATADHLRGDLDQARIPAGGLPRPVSVLLAAGESARPGLYALRIQAAAGGRHAAIEILVEILDAVLPDAGAAIGTYLEDAPHLSWFGEDAPRLAQRRCDLATLARLGLTGLAPPLAAPVGTEAAQFLSDLRLVRAAGFKGTLLAYAAAKRASARIGPSAAAEHIARAEASLKEEGLGPLAWSIADEPSNPGAPEDGIASFSRALQNATPPATRAGHLNHPDDDPALYDLLLVNAGFGIDAARIATLRSSDRKVWFYNTSRPRVSAGFYLWRSGAQGYLQWHARMPTADPFDPTDGRESDVQLLLPTPDVCPAVPDLHADLLRLAQGIADLRWLRWLDARAATSTDAKALRAEISEAIPATWRDASDLTSVALDRWRDRIAGLARRLR
ncbi:MAG: hypothetical protein JNK11_07965 [Alphaproteobacteria bacterium]|nr:hypothetical protein [Alphaproteobacteria bacterium]